MIQGNITKIGIVEDGFGSSYELIVIVEKPSIEIPPEIQKLTFEERMRSNQALEEYKATEEYQTQLHRIQELEASISLGQIEITYKHKSNK